MRTKVFARCLSFHLVPVAPVLAWLVAHQQVRRAQEGE